MNTPEIPTPRTDAEALWPASNDDSDRLSPDGGYVTADFARQLERELDEARKDSARLDWLDSMTYALNAQFETTYGWRVDWNHNRTSLAVTDCNLPALPIRAAIDAAMNPASNASAMKGDAK